MSKQKKTPANSSQPEPKQTAEIERKLLLPVRPFLREIEEFYSGVKD
ncbi:MAG: hypothetical protein HEQ26_05640 [Dolichospermum sp. DL01]|nr:MAG: hypothetical protein HEQ26_05640 [Dolichospermum sp. DL01]